MNITLPKSCFIFQELCTMTPKFSQTYFKIPRNQSVTEKQQSVVVTKHFKNNIKVLYKMYQPSFMIKKIRSKCAYFQLHSFLIKIDVKTLREVLRNIMYILEIITVLKIRAFIDFSLKPDKFTTKCCGHRHRLQNNQIVRNIILSYFLDIENLHKTLSWQFRAYLYSCDNFEVLGIGIEHCYHEYFP